MPSIDSGASTCRGLAEPVRATRSTVELSGFGGMALPVDEEFDLPISLDEGCYCAETLLCDVSVRRGEGLSPTVIELSTSVCSGDVDCDSCFPHLDGVCHLPALTGGDYRVRINGEDGYVFNLPVWRSDTEETMTNTPAPIAPEGLICPWQFSALGPNNQLCVPEQAFADASATVTFTDTCGSCFDEPADCVVTQQGSRLIVEARKRLCDCPTCGACADVCVSLTVSCRLPPLPAGTYTVLGGELTAPLEVVPGLPPFGPIATPMFCTTSTVDGTI